MIIIGVDPGVHKTAIALVENARLQWCTYGSLEDAGAVCACDVLVIEKPTWDKRSQEIRKKDLIDLTFAAGVAAGIFGTKAAKIEPVSPRRWKGTVRKDIMTKRIYNKLDEGEREIVDAVTIPSLRHNVLDAVGIALWKAERL